MPSPRGREKVLQTYAYYDANDRSWEKTVLRISSPHTSWEKLRRNKSGSR
ncbi:MAG TPA: hypothetical protein VMW93_03540 [bacterium]|nr:hypothetical protein [bacterium]